MNRKDLARKLTERLPITLEMAEEAISILTELIRESLANGARVSLVSFGIFSSKIRKGRTIADPQDPAQRLTVGPVRVVHFKAGLALKKRLKQCQQ